MSITTTPIREFNPASSSVVTTATTTATPTELSELNPVVSTVHRGPQPSTGGGTPQPPTAPSPPVPAPIQEPPAAAPMMSSSMSSTPSPLKRAAEELDLRAAANVRVGRCDDSDEDLDDKAPPPPEYGSDDEGREGALRQARAHTGVSMADEDLRETSDQPQPAEVDQGDVDHTAANVALELEIQKITRGLKRLRTGEPGESEPTWRWVAHEGAGHTGGLFGRGMLNAGLNGTGGDSASDSESNTTSPTDARRAYEAVQQRR